jgi:glycosyltransferase involved in cell wall biosynthesis
MNHRLAIVLAAFKPTYLRQAVESVLSQTSRDFNLYIFDDASPHNLRDELHGLPEAINSYHRFDENVGATSIVQQWRRCISHTNNEPWIWIFSDDDLMDKNCVESFFDELNGSPNHPAYRFNTRKIDAHDSVIRKNHFPEQFDAAEFLNLKLSYKEESYIVETIFSRSAYQKVGGIPDLPYAWAADDLFNAKIADLGTIRTIPGAMVSWRFSDENISGKKSASGALDKIKASQNFVHWINTHNHIQENLKPADLPALWYLRQIKNFGSNLSFFEELRAITAMRRSNPTLVKHYLNMKVNQNRITRWLKKFLL